MIFCQEQAEPHRRRHMGKDWVRWMTEPFLFQMPLHRCSCFAYNIRSYRPSRMLSRDGRRQGRPTISRRRIEATDVVNENRIVGHPFPVADPNNAAGGNAALQFSLLRAA